MRICQKRLHIQKTWRSREVVPAYVCRSFLFGISNGVCTIQLAAPAARVTGLGRHAAPSTQFGDETSLVSYLDLDRCHVASDSSHDEALVKDCQLQPRPKCLIEIRNLTTKPFESFIGVGL